MNSVTIRYWASVIGPNVNSQSGWLTGVLELLDNGFYAVRKENGQYLSINPTGDYTEAPSPRGVWEFFSINSGLNILNVSPSLVTYGIYFVQV